MKSVFVGVGSLAVVTFFILKFLPIRGKNIDRMNIFRWLTNLRASEGANRSTKINIVAVEVYGSVLTHRR